MTHVDEKTERLARENLEAARHRCEVDSIVRMYNEGGAGRVAKFLLAVEKHRGTAAAERLRHEAWEKIKHDRNKTTIQTRPRRSQTKGS